MAGSSFVSLGARISRQLRYQFCNSGCKSFITGASQRGLDGLILDCLFPRAVIEQLLTVLLKSRRLVLFGATGMGKSNLARQLARYLSIRIGASPQDAVVDIKISDDDHDKAMAQVLLVFIIAVCVQKLLSDRFS